MPPLIVLHEDHDPSAIWFADGLVARGFAVERFAGSDFAAVTRWRHRLGTGGIEIAIDFADGRSLGRTPVAGVLNRLHYLPWAMLAQMGGDDADYARQELFALFLSWLAAIPGPMFNRPTPQGLAGNLRHPSEWTMLAHDAGLPVAAWSQSETSDPSAVWQPPAWPGMVEVLALASGVVETAPLSAELAAGCRRLAARSDAGLIGVRFAPDAATGWRFVGATVTPDLFTGGAAAMALLIEAFGL